MHPGHRISAELETDTLLACLGALNEIDMGDSATLEAFDEIAAAGTRVSYVELRRQHDAHLLAGVLGIAVAGMLVHWYDGGAQQVVALAEQVHRAPPDDTDQDCRILVHALEVASALAEGRPSPTAEAAGRLARLLGDQDRARTAGELASVAVRLAGSAGSPRDHGLAAFALRMMGKAEKRLFVPLTPRAKYPPPRAAGVPVEVLAELAFRSIHGVFLSFRTNPQPGAAITSVDDFNAVVRDMLEDRDHVVFMNVQMRYQLPGQPPTDCPITRVELRFAQSLLKRLHEELVAAGATDVTLYDFLIDLLGQLLINRDLVEHRRDEHLFDWFVLSGAKPYRERAFFEDGVIVVMPMPPMMKVIIGELEDDIGPWDRYGFFAATSRKFLRLARSRLA